MSAYILVDNLNYTPAMIRRLESQLARLYEVERKAIEQSEYIQANGLTKFEMERKDAEIAALRAQVAEWERLFEQHVETAVIAKYEQEVAQMRAERDAVQKRNQFLFDTFRRVNCIKRAYRQQRDSARELNLSSAHYIAAIQEVVAPFRDETVIESVPQVIQKMVSWLQKYQPVIEAVAHLVKAAEQGNQKDAVRYVSELGKTYYTLAAQGEGK